MVPLADFFFEVVVGICSFLQQMWVFEFSGNVAKEASDPARRFLEGFLGVAGLLLRTEQGPFDLGQAS